MIIDIGKMTGEKAARTLQNCIEKSIPHEIMCSKPIKEVTILTAKQAKERQENNPVKLMQFDEIMNAIQKQTDNAESEEMSIFIYNQQLTKFTINKLEEIGYVINDFTCQKEGYSYKIDWSHA